MKDVALSKQSELNRFDNIDGLRTFGCMAIIAWHVLANSNFKISGGVFIDRVIPSWNFLVYLFMIISGFGMCNGYYDKVRNGTCDINRFYIKRYKKNVPFFAVLIIIDVLLQHSVDAVYEGFMEITMLFGFLPNNALSVIGVSWTLGAIFVFYIIFPYFVFLIYNRKRAWFSMAIALVITYMCQVYFMTGKFVPSNFTMRRSFLFCLPYFIAGGLIYLYRKEIICFLKDKMIFATLVCLLMTVFYYFIPDKVGGLDIIVSKTLLLYTLWFCYAIGCKNKVMSNRFTRMISEISMEMYLSHMIVFRVVEKLNVGGLSKNSYINYFLTYVCVVLILVIGLRICKGLINYFRPKFKSGSTDK